MHPGTGQTGHNVDTVGLEDNQISSVADEMVITPDSACPSTPEFEPKTSKTLPVSSGQPIMSSCSSVQDEEDRKQPQMNVCVDHKTGSKEAM